MASVACPTNDSLKVLKRLENGTLKTKLTIDRKMISRQMYNIRRSCGLKAKTWSNQAEAALVAWLGGARKCDRRTERIKRATGGPLAKKRGGGGATKRPSARSGMPKFMKALDDRLVKAKCVPMEGHIGRDVNKSNLIKRLVRGLPRATCIGQTGFNAGHSAVLFLESSKAQVVSFEVRHGRATKNEKKVKVGARFIDGLWPGRHVLARGNSQQSLPRFTKKHAEVGKVWDICFVDGGHSKTCALADLHNFQEAARPSALVLIDDVMAKPDKPWTVGPTAAWMQAIEEGWVEQLGASSHMAWGRFLD